MEITTKKLKLSQIKLNPDNPRRIGKVEMERLVKSLQDFPEMMELREIIVDENNTILGGNMRYRALKQIGEKECIAKIVTGLTVDQKREFIIKDNAAFGQYDMDALANLWSDLPLAEWGVDGLPEGWGKEAKEDDFDVETAVKEIVCPVTKPGEVWTLGKHRIMCGDSTKSKDVKKLMGGGTADMVFTSPPYWVGFEYENEKDKTGILSHINDICSILTKITRRVIINTGNIASISTAEKITGRKQPALLIDWWVEAMNRHNFMLRHIRIWAKAGGVTPSRANDKIDMHWEYIGQFTDENETAGFISTFNAADMKSFQNKGTAVWAVKGVWTDIQGNARSNGHVAAFPVVLPGRYILMYTKEGDLINEPYCGSGTTLIACEQLGRICYGMEIDPVYCDVIVKRWETLTGQKAVLES